MLSGLVSVVERGKEVGEFCEFFETKFGIQLEAFDLEDLSEFAPVIVE